MRSRRAHRKAGLPLIRLTLPILVVMPPAYAQRYTVTNVGTFGWGGVSRAHDINDAGQVVGYARASNGMYLGFLWTDGEKVNLGALGGNESQAMAINDEGHVVGWAKTNEGSTHAFLWDNVWFSDLNDLIPADSGWTLREANGINDRGQVVGFGVSPSGASRAFLWQHGSTGDVGTVTTIGTLGGETSYAYDINHGTEIVGKSRTLNDHTHAFHAISMGLTDLGTLGGQRSIAYAINKWGVIVGDSTTASDPNHEHAFKYSNGVMTDLGTLGGNQSHAKDINDSGQIVGWATLANGDRHAFVYDSTNGMQDLNDLISDSDWALAEATGINNSGQIVGWGILEHTEDETDLAFLLTQVPDGVEPITIPCPAAAALLTGFLAVAYWLSSPRGQKRWKTEHGE